MNQAWHRRRPAFYAGPAFVPVYAGFDFWPKFGPKNAGKMPVIFHRRPAGAGEILKFQKMPVKCRFFWFRQLFFKKWCKNAGFRFKVIIFSNFLFLMTDKKIKNIFFPAKKSKFSRNIDGIPLYQVKNMKNYGKMPVF